MRKNQQKELERLERALMEAEDADDTQHGVSAGYQMYNADDADVDLEDYSEEVYGQDNRRGLSVAVTMVAMVALSACILLLLQILGVF